jgi:hypothetical protein
MAHPVRYSTFSRSSSSCERSQQSRLSKSTTLSHGAHQQSWKQL